MAQDKVSDLEPEAFAIAAAVRYSGISRTRLYDLMENGEVAYFKVGTRRLVFRSSLRDYMWSRPKTSGVCNAMVRRA